MTTLDSGELAAFDLYVRLELHDLPFARLSCLFCISLSIQSFNLSNVNFAKINLIVGVNLFLVKEFIVRNLFSTELVIVTFFIRLHIKIVIEIIVVVLIFRYFDILLFLFDLIL